MYYYLRMLAVVGVHKLVYFSKISSVHMWLELALWKLDRLFKMTSCTYKFLQSDYVMELIHGVLELEGLQIKYFR